MHIALPQLAQVYGPIYRILFGRFPVIVVSDPDMVKEARRSCKFSSSSVELVPSGQFWASHSKLGSVQYARAAQESCSRCPAGWHVARQLSH